MSSYVSSIGIKKILPVLLICLTVMLVGGAAPFVPDVIAQAQAPAAEAAAPEAPAAPAPLKVDTGDTAWILASAVLVMAMTLPGLALFYGGLTRQKNILSTILHSFICLCLASIAWVLFGYSLSFVRSRCRWVYRELRLGRVAWGGSRSPSGLWPDDSP